MPNCHPASRSLVLDKILPQDGESLHADVLAVMSLWDGLLAREKSALGQELHVDVAQILAALRLDIALFIRQHQSNPALVAKASNMLAMTDQGLQTVGNFLNHLQFPSLEQGWQAILEQLCWDFSQRHALPCTFALQNACNNFDEQHSHGVFLILQEALNNIAKHAAAKHAWIVCSQAGSGGIEITVNDDGCGFDPEQAFNGQGLGLQAMRWRTMAMGGRIKINSKLNSGTQLNLYIPSR
jgi:signal transduction histidine kinase